MSNSYLLSIAELRQCIEEKEAQIKTFEGEHCAVLLEYEALKGDLHDYQNTLVSQISQFVKKQQKEEH